MTIHFISLVCVLIKILILAFREVFNQTLKGRKYWFGLYLKNERFNSVGISAVNCIWNVTKLTSWCYVLCVNTVRDILMIIPYNSLNISLSSTIACTISVAILSRHSHVWKITNCMRKSVFLTILRTCNGTKSVENIRIMETDFLYGILCVRLQIVRTNSVG